MKSNTLKITREMKLALTGLALVGAVGGWYTWSAGQAPTALPTPTQSPSATSTPEAAPAEAPASGDVTVSRPANPLDVQQIPFLTTHTPEPVSAEASTAPVTTAALDEDLANPFRPFSIQTEDLPQSAPVPEAPGTPPLPTVSTPQVVASAPPTPVTPGISAPIPLPSANVPRVTPFPLSTPTPLPSAPEAVTTAPAPAASAVKVTPAVKPPTPKLTIPGNGTLNATSVAPAAPAVASPPSAAPAKPVPAVPVPPLLSVASSVPAAPAEAVEPAETTAAPAAMNPLDAYIVDRDVTFNAVVLGPVNTGIFKTKNGYAVVSIGQTLPDSDIIVKDITTSAVTLALGDSTKTLELDKR